jgi:hypothetical protein
LKIGIDRQQERECVGIDDHDVEEIDRHQQDIVLEARQQYNDGDQRERQRRRGGRPAQHREPDEIQQTPGQNEGQARDEIEFRPEQDRQREKMRHREQHPRAATRHAAVGGGKGTG